MASAWGWQPYHLHVSLKSWSLNLLEPSGPVQACNGVALPLPLPFAWRLRPNASNYLIDRGRVPKRRICDVLGCRLELVFVCFLFSSVPTCGCRKTSLVFIFLWMGAVQMPGASVHVLARRRGVLPVFNTCSMHWKFIITNLYFWFEFRCKYYRTTIFVNMFNWHHT